MKNSINKKIKSFDQFAKHADYSFIETLKKDPDASEDGNNHNPREVFLGHYVPVNPTPIKNPQYIIHSKRFFKELGLDDTLVDDVDFIKMFSGDTTHLASPLKKQGWATGYALSIYGTEYYDQCPFRTGNGYGDGRAISIFEGIFENKRWEMQLKGAGQTPYCRGADGRAVLRSSIREFLAQEHMDALSVASTRSLSLFTSFDERVKRPWFRDGSYSKDPEVMIDEPIAITTRVASSFLRVGQLELFARRARKNEHPKAKEELESIILYTLQREYQDSIDQSLDLQDKLVLLAKEFQKRLISLVVNWIRVGYCQGNFNSDNCAVGGFTLDYGPFGFIDMFDPQYQPWTGGGVHFSFFNQANAAQRNFQMFCRSLVPLLEDDNFIEEIEKINKDFARSMNQELEKMWAKKLGLKNFDQQLFNELITLMMQTDVDYTIFFRELSSIPDDIEVLKKSFYMIEKEDRSLFDSWEKWLCKWHQTINITDNKQKKELCYTMKQINPKYTLREWFLVPAYEQAYKGDYSLIYELYEVMSDPYNEQSKEIEEKYYKKKPLALFDRAGISHVSCSS